MPISGYGVCKARPISRRLATGGSPHYQIELVDETGVHYRVAVNVKSQLAPSDLMFHVDPNFVHPITAIVEAKASGFTPLASLAGSGAMDFIRGNLFQPTVMIKIPALADGPDNDLNEKLDQVVQRAMADGDALAYAVGQRWGPETKADQYFGFIPGNGIHDIHMNQGNAGSFVKDDGVWQDGGLLFQFPKQSQWVGIFLKFQSQAWHTDNSTGHTLGDSGNPDPTGPPTETLPDGLVRILAAMVNSKESPEREWVYLLNTSDRAISLQGWSLADKQKAHMPLNGSMDAGSILKVPIQAPVALSNKGGLISVINDKGLKVHGVSYTKQQASNPGWTLAF
jgi:uncharacterized protein YukJ